jgi:hypothetical protein
LEGELTFDALWEGGHARLGPIEEADPMNIIAFTVSLAQPLNLLLQRLPTRYQAEGLILLFLLTVQKSADSIACPS